MLPRSPSESGLVVVTEHLQNLNIRREYNISRDNVYLAAMWLRVNNPLYSDIQIDYSVNLSSEPIIRLIATQSNEPVVDETADIDHYKRIGAQSRILRSSWNYRERATFNHQFAGHQSLPMALAMIIEAVILCPSKWSPCDLDFILLAGDTLFQSMIESIYDSVCPNTVLDKLNIKLLTDFRDRLTIFGVQSRIKFNDNPDYQGNLVDRLNKRKTDTPLSEALSSLFTDFIAGIAIVDSHSTCLMKNADSYFIADVQPCGTKGSKARSDNGKACDNLSELARIRRRAYGAMKTKEYRLHRINVVRLGNVDLIDQQLVTLEPRILSPNAPQPHTVSRNIGFSPINLSLRILRATTHQGDSAEFRVTYADVQCCAMVAAAIAKVSIFPLTEWTTRTLDSVMHAGDDLYHPVRTLEPSSRYGIDPSGHFQVRNFDVVRDVCIMFCFWFSFRYLEDTDLYGSLLDEVNDGILGRPLSEALTEFFASYHSGIIIAGSSSYGVMMQGSRYYFSDLHFCDPSGKSAYLDTACIIECNSLAVLLDLCRTKLGTLNVIYNLHHFHVQCDLQP
ncbi:hypothetical protein QAD02_000743 [Eretmocerus hayati]|uniref:Uncharacterized protein n=1 Tax=Eretmocerus hayati TaxID=131215 RepID=A0ACC2NGM0_9HYME|nr:hypothetical protein QAD02_000743 [Eretmocerus hayati]